MHVELKSIFLAVVMSKIELRSGPLTMLFILISAFERLTLGDFLYQPFPILPAPCYPPGNVTVSDVTDTIASISWTYSSNCSVPGFILGYRLVYDLVGMATSSRGFVQVMGAGNIAAVLTSLKPYSTYSIQVQAMTANGRDGLPSEVWVTTKEGGWCML